MSQIEVLKPDKVYVTLNSQVREIKYDLNAYAELEKKYGTVEEALGSLQKGSITGVRDLLWAGIIHDEAVIDERTGDVIKYNVTPYDVGSWIEPSQLKDLTLKVTEAIIDTLPAEAKATAKKEMHNALAAEEASKVVVAPSVDIVVEAPEKKE